MASEAAQGWDSVLDSVVVYAQGAVCRRVAGGSAPPDGRVRVTGLPRTLDPGSLRARVLNDSGVRVTEARIEVGAELYQPAELPELHREVERLRDEYDAARKRLDRQRDRVREVAALRPVAPPRRREDGHRRTPVDAWLDLAEFVDERLTGLHARLAELEDALHLAEHALGIAQDRLSRASTDAPSDPVRTALSAVLTLAGSGETEAEADLQVELEYRVPGAVWAPAYRLSYRQDDGTGSLVLRAMVAQRTGEDWNAVHIGLSTADLHRRTGLPKLRSLRIGRRQPAPAPSGWREPPAGLAELFTGYEAAGPGPAPRGLIPVAVAGAGVLPAPPPPPPPAAFPPAPAAPGGYAAAPPAVARSRALSAAPQGAAFAGAPPAPAAPGAAAPPVPPAGPPRPSSAELDYAALVLAGPEDPRNRRGRLFPAPSDDLVATEYRRRAEAVAALPLPGLAVRPRESAGSFDHRFDAAAPADIPSDGTWHTVTVTEIPVGLRTEYVCVPSVEETVYTTLVISNATDQALLAGPVEVTSDDGFLLTAALPTLAPGGTRRVGLGPAEAVRVARRAELHESSAGLRNGTTVLDHRVHVELANRLARPVTIEVRERVPVSPDADVRIEERADWMSPQDGEGPETHTPSTRLWRVELPADGTLELDGGYEIRIPAGKAIVGGNRRS
ncbi:DUF4139 domain-containing protein [Peterkaempfera sp. SMS 1(5)a]|uniref:DUF4139 domain-containing protein n=1 Tax=Peterkaempfera podocarpi TaxID=3232308 RepID=UPI00366E4298